MTFCSKLYDGAWVVNPMTVASILISQRDLHSYLNRQPISAEMGCLRDQSLINKLPAAIFTITVNV